MELIERKLFQIILVLWLRVKEFYRSMSWGGYGLSLSLVWGGGVNKTALQMDTVTAPKLASKLPPVSFTRQ